MIEVVDIIPEDLRMDMSDRFPDYEMLPAQEVNGSQFDQDRFIKGKFTPAEAALFLAFGARGGSNNFIGMTAAHCLGMEFEDRVEYWQRSALQDQSEKYTHHEQGFLAAIALSPKRDIAVDYHRAFNAYSKLTSTVGGDWFRSPSIYKYLEDRVVANIPYYAAYASAGYRKVEDIIFDIHELERPIIENEMYEFCVSQIPRMRRNYFVRDRASEHGAAIDVYKHYYCVPKQKEAHEEYDISLLGIEVDTVGNVKLLVQKLMFFQDISGVIQKYLVRKIWRRIHSRNLQLCLR